MVENCRSSGVAIDDAIVSGLAPGNEALTTNCGEVDVGQVAHRQHPVGHQTEKDDRQRDERRHHRAADETLGQVHEGTCCAG